MLEKFFKTFLDPNADVDDLQNPCLKIHVLL